jgi:hypothetical protein
MTDDDICGFTYDHDIQAKDWHVEDGLAVAVCRRCGAELMVEEEVDE